MSCSLSMKSQEWKTLIYVPTINVFGEKIVNPLIQLGSLYFYPKEKMSNFPECGLLSQLNMDKLNMD